MPRRSRSGVRESWIYRSLDHASEARPDVRTRRAKGDAVVAFVRHPNLADRPAAHGIRRRQQVVEENAEAVDFARTEAGRPARTWARGRAVCRPDRTPSCRRALSRAEVHQDDAAVLSADHVVRLDVAVEQSGGVNGRSAPARSSPIRATSTLPKTVPWRSSCSSDWPRTTHPEANLLADLLSAVDRHDVRVTDSCEQAAFLQDRAALRVAPGWRGQDFQRDFAVEPRVPRAKDFTERTLPDVLERWRWPHRSGGMTWSEVGPDDVSDAPGNTSWWTRAIDATSFRCLTRRASAPALDSAPAQSTGSPSRTAAAKSSIRCSLAGINQRFPRHRSVPTPPRVKRCRRKTRTTGSAAGAAPSGSVAIHLLRQAHQGALGGLPRGFRGRLAEHIGQLFVAVAHFDATDDRFAIFLPQRGQRTLYRATDSWPIASSSGERPASIRPVEIGQSGRRPFLRSSSRTRLTSA